jgi:membrane protease YdiL (CAAX protease family)
LNPLVIGITAGVWEETLFRAALQPVIGIWWTSLIFVLCHTGTGQFWKMNWKKAVYAAGVFAASVMLGLIFENIGLLAAITTHAAIDVIGLYAMRHLRKRAMVMPQNT